MAKFLDANGLLYLWSKITTLVSGKVDKVDGKGLSTNDLTNDLKTNYDLASLHSAMDHAPVSAEKNVIIGVQKNGTDLTVDSSRKVNVTVPTKVSELANDSGFITDADVPGAYELPVASSTTLGGVKIGSNVYKDNNNAIYVRDASTAAKGVVKLMDNLGYVGDDTAPTSQLLYDVRVELVNSLGDKAKKATSLSGYGITDAYTKTEVDAKLTSAVTYKGTKASYSELPTSDNKTGDMWNITAADSAHGIKAGDNVVWNGSGWDVQSGTVDLSGCVQNADAITNAEIDTIVGS